MTDDINYIKIDGEPDEFEGGAIRYSKKGKGRYDLIPEEAFYLLLSFADFEYGDQPAIWVSTSDILKSAYTPGPDRYVRTLFDFILYEYCKSVKDEQSHDGKLIAYNDWIQGLNKAIKDLAIHYEFGAEKYGVDNWKKGILRTGGDRGGSFTDSGLRHLNQYIAGETDEKLVEIVRENFDLRPAGIIKMLDLRRPIYKQTAAYGHFGRNDLDLPWEALNKVDDLKKYL